MPPPALPAKQPDGTIHLVRGGKTLCNVLTVEMNRKHRWVELKGFDAHEATCKGCLMEKQNRELRARGVKASKPKAE